MFKKMICAVIAAIAIASFPTDAQGALYKWGAQLIWFPCGTSCDWSEVQYTNYGTIEINSANKWLGFYSNAGSAVAVTASTREDLMAILSGHKIYLAMEVDSVDFNREPEVTVPDNYGTGECIFVAQVSYESGDYLNSVPEPSTFFLVALGLAFLALRRKRNKLFKCT